MSTPLRVLIVEDSEDDLILTVYELSRHDYDLVYKRVETAEAMRAALDSEQWDVILSDYSMPQFSALAALKIVRERHIETPFIIISGTVGEETAVAAMKAGAHDFFPKDKLVLLVPAIEREMREAEERRKRRWAEEQLRQSEELFAKAFQSGPMSISITTLDGVYIDVNDAFLQLYGYNQGEVIGNTALELGVWDDVALRNTIVQAIREGKNVEAQELQVRTKSGERRDVLCSFAPISLAGQACMLSMFQDITQRKRAEEERNRLLEQKQAATQEFLNVLERITEGFVMLDRDWNYTFVNPKAGELLGRNAENLIGMNVWKEFPATVGRPLYTAMHEAVATQQAAEVETYFEPWGRWFVNRLYPSESGLTIFFQDVSERKRQEQAALDAERLRVEIEKEREVIQLKENFISIVSHEFRTPLTAIMSSAELVQLYYDHLPRERHIHHIGEILSQSGFMVGLLDDILTVNKGRAGRMEFNPAVIDLNALCQGIVERARVQDKEQHQLIVQIESDLTNVVMDGRLLQHILVNLLTNAIKYSPDGGDVRLEISREDDDVVIQVSDQGIGIPAEAIARLYEPFQRAANVGQIRGTGLGLAIVKESVERHGGAIMCQSQVGVGTIFTVRLPATQDKTTVS